jgi:hypothetical protein
MADPGAEPVRACAREAATEGIRRFGPVSVGIGLIGTPIMLFVTFAIAVLGISAEVVLPAGGVTATTAAAAAAVCSRRLDAP